MISFNIKLVKCFQVFIRIHLLKLVVLPHSFHFTVIEFGQCANSTLLAIFERSLVNGHFVGLSQFTSTVHDTVQPLPLIEWTIIVIEAAMAIDTSLVKLSIVNSFAFESQCTFALEESMLEGTNILVSIFKCILAVWTTHDVIFPHSLVFVLIEEFHCTFTMFLSILKLAFVLIAVLFKIDTLTFHLIINPVTFVKVSMRIELFSMPIFHVLFPVSFVNCSVTGSINSISCTENSPLEFASVCINDLLYCSLCAWCKWEVIIASWNSTTYPSSFSIGCIRILSDIWCFTFIINDRFGLSTFATFSKCINRAKISCIIVATFNI